MGTDGCQAASEPLLAPILPWGSMFATSVVTIYPSIKHDNYDRGQ